MQHQYPPHTLAPDPHQAELSLRPPRPKRPPHLNPPKPVHLLADDPGADIPDGCPICGLDHPDALARAACVARSF